MNPKIFNLTEKICGYSICFTFFSILISTAASNIAIIVAVASGLLLIIQKKEHNNIFIKNKINLTLVLIVVLLIFSYTYTIASFSESLALIKKYIKLLYIPICYFILKIEWIRIKAINYFIAGCTIILILSYLKYFNILPPLFFLEFSNFLGVNYEKKLLGGVTIFQHSIIHGVIFSFFFFVTFFKAKKEASLLYYALSFFSFYNILFMNISRTAYLITFFLVLIIIYDFYKENKFQMSFLMLIFLGIILLIGNKSIIYERYVNTVNNISAINKNHYATSFGLRYLYTDNGISNMYLSPIIGHGVGSYKSTISDYFNKNNIDLHNFTTQNPHNEYISIITQIGLLGFTVFLYFIFSFARSCFHTITGKSVLTIFIITCMFNSMFYDNVIGIFAVLIISYAMQKKEISL